MKVKVKSLSRVQLLATPWTSAHQAPPSMGFSRQEYWSGLPFPSEPKAVPRGNFIALNDYIRKESESEVAQSCPTLHDPMDCSLRKSQIGDLKFHCKKLK